MRNTKDIPNNTEDNEACSSGSVSVEISESDEACISGSVSVEVSESDEACSSGSVESCSSNSESACSSNSESACSSNSDRGVSTFDILFEVGDTVGNPEKEFTLEHFRKIKHLLRDDGEEKLSEEYITIEDDAEATEEEKIDVLFLTAHSMMERILYQEVQYDTYWFPKTEELAEKLNNIPLELKSYLLHIWPEKAYRSKTLVQSIQMGREKLDIDKSFVPILLKAVENYRGRKINYAIPNESEEDDSAMAASSTESASSSESATYSESVTESASSSSESVSSLESATSSTESATSSAPSSLESATSSAPSSS